MKKKYVSRLEDIAFTACLKEILGNLLICPEHRPEDKRKLYSYSSIISLHPNLFSGSNVRSFIRNRLNQHLIGIMNDDIRKRLICEFNNNLNDSDQNDQILDIWVFLDCVLDSSFTELDTHVVAPNEKIVKTIAYRSPNIETLKLNFEMANKTLGQEKIEPIVTSLATLVNLTSLSLCSVKKHQRNMLSSVGHSCPNLTHFCITGFRIEKKDILALILGEKLKMFPKKEVMLEEENDIHKFQILPEYLVPLCTTLQHLQLEDVDEKEKLMNCALEYSGLGSSAAAFALRHMKNLRQIDHSSSSVSSAVELLFSQNSKEVYGEVNDENGFLHLSNSMAANVPFFGVISLTSLDFINIRSVEMMKAVGRMCPALKEVTFSDMRLTYWKTPITPDQLFTILTTEWPKVERVTFIEVSPNYRKAVLLGIGAQLSNLTYVSCESIDMGDLVSCTALEVLRILFTSTLIRLDEKAEKFPIDAFLPKLHYLKSDICLHSRYSHLFEEKMSMTHLELYCCHVGTAASTMNWRDITKFWQRIQTLHIRQCTGLDMSLIKSISLQLTKLKELTLPSGMRNSKEQRELSYELEDYFNKSNQKIRLNFQRRPLCLYDYPICPYQAPSCPYETSDTEMSSESEESCEFNKTNEDMSYRSNHSSLNEYGLEYFDDNSYDFFDYDDYCMD